MIHKCDEGGYVISSHQVLIPGCFDTERTARFAFRLTPCQQQKLANRVNADEGRLITWDDVKAMRACKP